MPTGYDVQFYLDMERLRRAAESIAKSLESLERMTRLTVAEMAEPTASHDVPHRDAQ